MATLTDSIELESNGQYLERILKSLFSHHLKIDVKTLTVPYSFNFFISFLYENNTIATIEIPSHVSRKSGNMEDLLERVYVHVVVLNDILTSSIDRLPLMIYHEKYENYKNLLKNIVQGNPLEHISDPIDSIIIH